MEISPLTGTRYERESKKAVIACNDYLRLGPGRSFSKLLQKYAENTTEAAPVKALRTIQHWSSDYHWQERAEAFDAQVEAEKERRRREIMESGLALDYERVAHLKELYSLLDRELETHLYMEDVKQIGGGKYAERVDILRYNSALVNDLLRVLDDLAKETGGRVAKHDISGKVDFSKMSDEDLKRFILERLGNLGTGS